MNCTPLVKKLSGIDKSKQSQSTDAVQRSNEKQNVKVQLSLIRQIHGKLICLQCDRDEKNRVAEKNLRDQVGAAVMTLLDQNTTYSK